MSKFYRINDTLINIHEIVSVTFIRKVEISDPYQVANYDRIYITYKNKDTTTIPCTTNQYETMIYLLNRVWFIYVYYYL